MMSKKLVSIVLISFLMTGCSIGNGRICGPQTPAINCNKEGYERLMDTTPYIEKWKKENGTPGGRDVASEECGGGRGKYAPVIPDKVIQAERLPGESKDKAYDRLRINWQRCMVKKGYRYTGECYGTRNTPACGAP